MSKRDKGEAIDSPVVPQVDIVAALKAARGSRVQGPDRIVRTPAEEDKLNEVFAAAFGTPNGKAALAYLRAITVETVAPAEFTDGQIRYLEGMRFLVSIIENRKNRGIYAKS